MALVHLAGEQTEFQRGPAHGLEVTELDLKPKGSKCLLLQKKAPRGPQDFTSEVHLAKLTYAWSFPPPAPWDSSFLS